MPFSDALTFGETAERAVAPLAMELDVGDACAVGRRGGGVALADEDAVAITKGRKDAAEYKKRSTEANGAIRDRGLSRPSTSERRRRLRRELQDVRDAGASGKPRRRKNETEE